MGGNSGRKVEPASQHDDGWAQLADGIVLVDVGPTEKNLKDVRVRIRAGENRDRVINELEGRFWMHAWKCSGGS